MRPILLAALALFAAPAASAYAQAGAPPPDYASAASWVCRPGDEARCTTGLDATVVSADGSRTAQPFQAAADAPIDCFYVYPTTSEEPSDYADMQATPKVVKTVHDQAGRLTERCRLYAPIYRQLTGAGLHRMLDAHSDLSHAFDAPTADVIAAWRWYLANANHGRGVVVVGHSQGAIVLQALIAHEIDGKPVQSRLVSAFLAGDPGLPVPKGARVGGVFKSVPLCRAAAEVGCVYVWGDYLADDTREPKVFGADPGGGMEAGCVDPAAPSGGSGLLKPYLHRPAMAPDSDPPWVAPRGQLSVACVNDGHNNVARVTILPSRYARLLTAAFSETAPGWGLHPRDMELTQGNILNRLTDETATWAARGGR